MLVLKRFDYWLDIYILVLDCDVNAVELRSESGGCGICVCKPGFAGSGNKYLCALCRIYSFQ